MTRQSSKPTIAHLVEICAAKGLHHAVISPGSRNAALTISLDEHPDIKCFAIPDERVAGFFALGMAQELEAPVILCCTSGSAMLNYAPALVEAFYQKIPILILSADRPPYWIDQRAGQTMRQQDAFANYVKASFTLFCDPLEYNGIWYNDRIVNQAIDETTLQDKGPVHINIPMNEPLYDTIDSSHHTMPKVIRTMYRQNVLSVETEGELVRLWHDFHRVLIIVGQHNRSELFDDAIERMAIMDHVVVLTETTSNVVADGVYRSIDRLIDSILPEEYDTLAPDLIISCGGSLVSKKLRYMLRQMQVGGHWHVDADDRYIDTYQALTLNVPMMLEELVPLLCRAPSTPTQKDKEWKELWVLREYQTKEAHERFLLSCPWSDLWVMHQLHKLAPSGLWYVANSTPVRYTQLFETRKDLTYRSNRGVSGIDGCTSTAVGAACIVEDIVTMITGDIAFFYDSNAFWHHHVPTNLRVFMINNEGGNIFRYVKGPMETAQFETHFEAHHKTSAAGIAQAYGVAYIHVVDESTLADAMTIVFDPAYKQAVIVEVQTPREANIEILKQYFRYISDYVHQN